VAPSRYGHLVAYFNGLDSSSTRGQAHLEPFLAAGDLPEEHRAASHACDTPRDRYQSYGRQESLGFRVRGPRTHLGEGAGQE
jgi:hypothetical protein